MLSQSVYKKCGSSISWSLIALMVSSSSGFFLTSSYAQEAIQTKKAEPTPVPRSTLTIPPRTEADVWKTRIFIEEDRTTWIEVFPVSTQEFGPLRAYRYMMCTKEKGKDQPFCAWNLELSVAQIQNLKSCVKGDKILRKVIRDVDLTQSRDWIVENDYYVIPSRGNPQGIRIKTNSINTSSVISYLASLRHGGRNLSNRIELGRYLVSDCVRKALKDGTRESLIGENNKTPGALFERLLSLEDRSPAVSERSGGTPATSTQTPAQLHSPSVQGAL